MIYSQFFVLVYVKSTGSLTVGLVNCYLLY